MSLEAANTVRVEGQDNDLLDRVVKDPYFAPILDQLPSLLDPSTFIGCAPDQVNEQLIFFIYNSANMFYFLQVTYFLKEEVQPIVSKYIAQIKTTATKLDI